MLIFLSVFTVLNSTKKSKENLTLHHMGKNLLVNLLRYNFKSGGLNFWKVFLPLKIFGMDFRFSRNRRFTKCALGWIRAQIAQVFINISSKNTCLKYSTNKVIYWHWHVLSIYIYKTFWSWPRSKVWNMRLFRCIIIIMSLSKEEHTVSMRHSFPEAFFCNI